MARLLISLGANLGNSYETMLAASRMLKEAFGSSSVDLSRLYVTPPIGGPSGQSDFLNAIASIRTGLNCWEVWDIVKRIEKDLGRQRQHRWEARRLDMDILLYDDARIWTPHLKVPHPRMCMRSFVLVPAMEVAADMIDPVTGWSVSQLYENLRATRKSKIMIYCNTQNASNVLSHAFRLETREEHNPSISFSICPSPSQIENCSSDEACRTVLSIFCIRTPEPETIQWEDFAFPWAQSLGLVDKQFDSHVIGPRYLLPDHELDWTVHEIHASRQAMTCTIDPFERPFGNSGT